MANALLLQAVIDESGKFKDKNVICLAGMLAFGSFWTSLEARWRDRLQKHGIEYFHAKELWRWDGIYAAKRDMWGEAGREQVLIDFATAVQQTILTVMALSNACISMQRRGKPSLVSSNACSGDPI